ncbi:MAG: alpha/beta fold hydrolase [Atopobiaceae bacterium]
MLFETLGDPEDPAILFFHAMGVTGASSEPVAQHLMDSYFCIMPTATPYCPEQHYVSKADEVDQVERFLEEQGIGHLELVVASSLGADLAVAFLAHGRISMGHAVFDGGQFAQIGRGARRLMCPFLYLAIKSLCRSHGKTLKHILWCDDDAIKPYFIEAGKALTYRNLCRMMGDSLEDRPFPKLSEELQRHTFWEFGSIEDHFKYRPAVMAAWPEGSFPVFEGYNHMQYQIEDPEGFAAMLRSAISCNRLPELHQLI